MSVDQLNAEALAANIADMRSNYEARIVVLEKEIGTLKVLVQKQSSFIGQAMQGLMGSGATVKE